MLIVTSLFIPVERFLKLAELRNLEEVAVSSLQLAVAHFRLLRAFLYPHIFLP